MTTIAIPMYNNLTLRSRPYSPHLAPAKPLFSPILSPRPVSSFSNARFSTLPAAIRQKILRYALLYPYASLEARQQPVAPGSPSSRTKPHYGSTPGPQLTTAGQPTISIQSRALVSYMRQTGNYYRTPYWGTEAMTRILRVNRQFYQDGIQILYSECVIDFPHYNTAILCWEWAATLNAQVRNQVLHIGDLALLTPRWQTTSFEAADESSDDDANDHENNRLSIKKGAAAATGKVVGPPMFAIDEDKRHAWAVLAQAVPNVRTFTLGIAFVNGGEAMDAVPSEWLMDGFIDLINQVMGALEGFRSLQTVVLEYRQVGPFNFEGARWRIAEIGRT